MERTQIISLRLPVSIIEDLKKLQESQRYLNRSFIIQHILEACLYCGKDGALWKILNCYDPISDGISIYARAEKDRPKV